MSHQMPAMPKANEMKTHERLLETYVAMVPRGFRSFRMAVPVWIKEKLFQKGLLRCKLQALAAEVDWEAKLLFAEHHQSHAASAFYPSPSATRWC